MQSLCLFDLDRTLLEGRTIEHLGDVFGLRTEIREAMVPRGEPGASGSESKALMALFRGVEAARFEAACRGVPLHPAVTTLGPALARLGCTTAVATASYMPAAARAADAIGARHVAALAPEIDQGRLTGAIRPGRWEGACGRMVCKTEVLERLREVYRPATTIAVGDGANDVCMFRAADLAIAVGDAHPDAVAGADVGPVDLGKVPRLVARHLERDRDRRA